MQRNNPDPSFWFFLPPVSTSPRAFRRSNLIAIAILVFFTIGLLLIGFVPEQSSHTLATGHPQPKIGGTPPAHHIR
jgi:hypothetical protein